MPLSMADTNDDHHEQMIFSFNFVHCFCISVIFVQPIVPKLQRCLAMLLHHIIQALCAMRKTSVFTTQHWQIWVTFTIYLLDRIPICLNIVRHKSLEVHVQHSILHHGWIQVFPKESLCNAIFQLHVTTRNGHTLQYSLPYTWHTRVVQSFICLTWSSTIHEFFKTPPTCIRLTRSTPLPRRSIDNLKTIILSLNYPKNLLP